MSVLTPMEIQAKEFNKSIRGYDVKEVDNWVQKVKENYERLYVENHELKERLEQNEQSLVHYKDLEDALQRTLVMAQKNAEDMKNNAEREAKVILEQAEMAAKTIKQRAEEEAEQMLKEASQKAEEMLKMADQRVGAILEEYRRLERQANVFRVKFKAFLEAQMDMLEGKLEPEQEQALG
ncbi:DivIVA domain protein [Desulfotomaculum nigrificans CO-1-SRB]|uniref:DivIVA domain protein n=1 Tax=Desulfotomaculum nigrificans (strain DSM 14880 / VKM B-2319 / CO-1-SRB) TaxID=868595 RepID=F6B393_DESCC|nr:DivIVA domain-containing protein [Desulfotomaculum nigrificans]AEF95124.1 DivIVA domain protein [Desulfotomaculum nigrificans CO-1-SRB]